MQQEFFSQWEQCALLHRDETAYDTVRFFRNANDIFGLYEVWGRFDRFYFIPIKPRLQYCYRQTQIADGEIWLGAFVRCVLEHEDLFSTRCPGCGRQLFPYGFRGAALTGGVRFETACPCGCTDKTLSGSWGLWGGLLRETQRSDEKRYKRARLFHPGFKATTIESLIEYLWQ